MVAHMKNLQELIKKNPPVISYYDCHYLDFFSIAVIKNTQKEKGFVLVNTPRLSPRKLRLEELKRGNHIIPTVKSREK